MKKYSLNELKVKTTKEFICTTYHFHIGETYTAWEEDNKYVVKLSGGDMCVPKNEFKKYFEIVEVKNHAKDVV